MEEAARKLTEDLQAAEDKVNSANKVSAKLTSTLDDLGDSLDREKNSRQDLEKEKRKLEGETKVAQENIDELGRQKQDIENHLRKYSRFPPI
jgi:peptidoglycan hydrolase CwlO-like protein